AVSPTPRASRPRSSLPSPLLPCSRHLSTPRSFPTHALPISIGQRLAEDHGMLACRAVLLAEAAAALDRDAQGGEISGRNHAPGGSEEHTSELQSRVDLVCRLLLEKAKE